MPSVPSSAATRPASPCRPVPAVSSAPPTPSSAISMAAMPFRRETRTDAADARAYLATLARASQATKYAASSTCSGRRSGLWNETAVGTLAREASESSAALRPGLSTAEWIPRARSRSPSNDRESSSPAALIASASSGSPWTRRSIMRRASATDTSRCCAPSWRVRSSPRPLLAPVVAVPLAPPPLRVARGDETLARGAQLAEPLPGLRLKPRVVERDRSRGSDGVHELWIVVERLVVDEHRQLAPVALDRRGHAVATRRGQLHGLSPAVHIGALPRHEVRQHEAGVAKHLGEPVLQPDTAQRAELAEEIREPSARKPGAQQGPGQRSR